MMYDINKHIKTIDDVKEFFHHLAYERNLNFHPDDDFVDYVCLEDNCATFSKDEVALYNRLMSEAFEICKTKDVDIYELGFEILSRTAEA